VGRKRELQLQRNFGPAQHKFGNVLGSAYAFVDINLFNGKLPWTLSDDLRPTTSS
jgi:electron-transferring-flavoprotein dehydrogenase